MTTTANNPHKENLETFMARCEVFLPHSECVRIRVAYRLAKGSHAHQTRKDERNPDGSNVRYLEHLRRVALFLIDEVGIVIADLIIEALLHDSVEDTNLSPEEITFVFGADVARRVMLMSKVPKVGFKTRLVRHGDWMVWLVKASDRIDNLRTMDNSPKTFRDKQVAETREMYYPLMDLLVDNMPPEYVEPGREVRRILREACETVAAMP